MTQHTNISLPGFRFTHAEPANFAVIAALFQELHQFNSSLDACFALAENWRDLLHEHFKRTYNSPNTLWLLAWHKEQPAGLLMVEVHKDSPLFQHRNWAELTALYVEPAYRGSDMAACLVTFARDWAAMHGFNRLELYVTASNERAKKFYWRCGLRPVQEIWRLEVDPDAEPVFDIAANQAGDAWKSLLEPGQHYMCAPDET
ncbi:MAG: GNAT family N-acetyltransferase [Chloroflexaceae bacterium]|nr:GNAT family N-acetyltransferase [Chloroflexaceae bacterium]NJO07662.1 GNAT family N-acetyltransferase [Chloroflexaceae bacterium]